MPFSLRAPRAATACLVALALAFGAALAAPEASGQPSPSPSPSGSAAPGPAPGEVGVILLNPNATYDDPPNVSDRFDGVDALYTIVARTLGTAESLIVEASYAPQNSDGTTYGNEVLIGELTRIGPTSDVWQIDWDIPQSIADGTGRIVVRAFVETPAGFVETGSDAEVVELFHRDPSGPPLGAWETVDILWPEQGGALGWFKPRVGSWRTIVDGRTSSGTTHVQIFVSATPPGEEAEFVSCGSGSATASGAFDTFAVRCALAGTTLPSEITSIAALSEYRDPAGNSFLQAADVRTVTSYDVSPSQMTVEITPVARRVPAPAAFCQSFAAVVRDDHGRLVLGANVDIHATGPADELILSGTTMFVPDPHTTEQTEPCPSDLPIPANPRRQGDHNVPGGIDIKHMETNQGTGLDANSQPSGQAQFTVASDRAGITELTAWVDEEEIASETEQRAADGDTLEPGEPFGRGMVQWLPGPPTLSLDPLGGTAPAGSCFPYVVKARAGTAPMPKLNVDVHATGPDGELDFCDAPGSSERRAPAAGAGANAHEAEGATESHHASTSGAAAQHTEGETDAAGNFVVGLTSPVAGDSTIVAWIDGEPGADDDVLGGSETSASGTVSWVASTDQADLSFVNPSPYGGVTDGDGRGTQVPDSGGSVDVRVRVDMAGAVPGVDVLLSTDSGRTFALLGAAERVRGTDLFTIEWPVHVPDGNYTLRARIAGTSVIEDLTVKVGAGDLLPMVPNPDYETLVIRRPEAASGAAFTRRSTVVSGRASAGAEGVDVYYTKVPAKDTPAQADWIYCGYAGLDGTGSGTQEFSTPCTLANADQAGQVTGIAAITYDCQAPGCNADPFPPPPAEGAPSTEVREPGQKDTGDAIRVFGYDAQPRLAVEPPEAEAVAGDCRRFEVVLLDQTGQPIGDENVDLHLTGPSASTHFCRPADGASVLRAPDGGGHVATGSDPAAQLEGAHSSDVGAGPLHSEGETLPDGTLVFGVTSEDAGDAQLLAWLDRNDDDTHGGDEPSDDALLHWVEAGGCSIIGSEGPDVLTGTAGADVICALEGNDVVRGRGGADVVYAGAGADRLLGGAGRDSLRGARGRDRLNGGPGRDVCRGGPGRDRIKRCERPKKTPARRSGV